MTIERLAIQVKQLSKAYNASLLKSVLVVLGTLCYVMWGIVKLCISLPIKACHWVDRKVDELLNKVL